MAVYGSMIPSESIFKNFWGFVQNNGINQAT